MKVLYVAGKGYYVAERGDQWSTWTHNILEATLYDEPEATNTAVTRREITGHRFQVRDSPFNEDELEALRHKNMDQAKAVDLLMSGMFQ